MGDSKNKINFLMLLLFAVMISGVDAATEFRVTEVTGTGDVLTNGPLVEAVNFGGGDTTLNGLTFTGSSDTSVFSQTGGTGIRADVASCYSATAGGLPDFVGLLNVGAWQRGTAVVGATFTLGLTGLDIGEDYRFQLFSGETRANQNHPMTVTVEGSTSDIYTYGTRIDAIDKTIRVDAYFTASATDVDVTLTVPDYDPISGGLMFHAYALHAVSDIGGGQSSPSSLLLFEPSPDPNDFSLQLTGPEPTEDVIVTVDPGGIAATAADIQLSSGGVTANPGEAIILTFTPETYSTEQIVSVVPVLDGETEGEEQALIVFQLSGDSAYAGGYIPPVNVTISDICAVAIMGDLDGNCTVNLTDFARLANAWLACTTPFGQDCVNLQ